MLDILTNDHVNSQHNNLLKPWHDNGDLTRKESFIFTLRSYHSEHTVGRNMLNARDTRCVSPSIFFFPEPIINILSLLLFSLQYCSLFFLRIIILYNSLFILNNKIIDKKEHKKRKTRMEVNIVLL